MPYFEIAIRGQLRALEAAIIAYDQPLQDAAKASLPALEKFSPSPSRKVHRFATGAFAKSWAVVRLKPSIVRFVNSRPGKGGTPAHYINQGYTSEGEALARSYRRRRIAGSYVEHWFYFAKGEQTLAKAYEKGMNRRNYRGL